VKLGTVELRPLLEPDINVTDPLDRKIVSALRHILHKNPA
jgi:hypothetical protein